MVYLLEIRTDLFDASAEPENPINPIYGHSLLKWLAARLREKEIEAPSEPDYEDWGWYFDLTALGSKYLVGASAESDEDKPPSGDIDWVIQIHKHRRFSEKLRGANKLTVSDPLCAAVEKIVQAEKRISKLRSSLES